MNAVFITAEKTFLISEEVAQDPAVDSEWGACVCLRESRWVCMMDGWVGVRERECVDVCVCIYKERERAGAARKSREELFK